MVTLQTIEEIHRLFPTMGSSPALVTCDDFRDWVCKYDRSPLNLFNELIAAKFAEIWRLMTPEVCFIQVKQDHIPLQKFPQLQYDFFNKECFGSLYLEDSKEIDLTTVSLFKQKGFIDKLGNKEDFLKIALFDIWLANEDRNHNNFNLLLHASSEKLNFLYAIDHVNIFNSSFLNYGIAELTEDDSIIKTELAKILFGGKRKLPEIVENLVQNFYLCISECKERLDEILALVPESWNLNTEYLRQRILDNIFTEDWNETCINNFRIFIQSFIVN
ncbi:MULTISPECIES: HipA family kinase [unclassified Sphingobacterium]|uniref:HipA family kinase n=1 Tax=unclassified Sphingobacterium TaxID=2609468 RepID=UPI0025F04FC1|nr:MULTISPECIES: HipA family kinase [unclassified Sphingobacterium]